MKKAQGMSMNIIVVAAIALIILVVLIVIFVQRSGKFTSGVDECKGTCVADVDAQCSGDYQKYDRFQKCTDPATGKADENNPYCCVSIV
ncbi:MAG: hypothetical protein ACE5DM_00840 [Candidatus Nanoarchaeia archaeon]